MILSSPIFLPPHISGKCFLFAGSSDSVMTVGIRPDELPG
jgi:hypothetical protein